MMARRKGAAIWSPLSSEARSLIEDLPRFTWRAWRDGVLIAERVGVALLDEVEAARQEAARMGWTFEADDGFAWGYVSLSDGAAAQRCAFGVACRGPDVIPAPNDPTRVRDAAQADFGF
ncbi:MAG: hypothetical protein ACK4UQ_06690 [Brevundimonas sp.]